MVERIPGFGVVLGRGCLPGMDFLGLSMLTFERVKPTKPQQPVEKQTPVVKNKKATVPDEWDLTPEQKAFIDLFNQDENKKQ